MSNLGMIIQSVIVMFCLLVGYVIGTMDAEDDE